MILVMTARAHVSHPSTDGPPGATDESGSWWWFIGWFGVGALCALAVIGMLTIGIFVLPVALLGATVLTLATNRARTRPPAGAGWGALSGASFPLLYVAYLNRRGPGTVCDVTPQSTHCAEMYSPWPWLGVALVLICSGAGLHVLARRRHR